MNNQKMVRYLKYATIGVLYLILVTPVLLYSRYLFPFITTKTVYFRLLVELLIILYTALAMAVPAYRPKMTKVSWAVLVFGLIIFLTGLTGVNFYKSFWGTIERGEGFLTISHLLAYFLILTWIFKTKKEWVNYLTGAVVIGTMVNFYAWLQKLNQPSFLGIRIIHAGEGRLSGTIGNAAFLGAYTLQIFFFSLILFFERKKILSRGLFLLAALFSLLVLYHTQTRGAVLALVFGFFLLGFLVVISPADTKQRKIFKISAIAVLILVTVFGALVFLSRNKEWVENQSTLNRLVSISKNDITTQSRFYAWDTSFKGLKNRFLLGYGWENYNVAFDRYFHPEIFVDQGSQLWFDRAHNTVFDVAVATGIVGLINYLAIFALAIWGLFKMRKQEFFLSLILITALVVHFLQNIFVFDVLASYINLFIMFALASFISFSRDEQEQEEPASGKLNYFVLAGLFLVMIFLANIFNLKPLKANELSVKALYAAAAGEEMQAIEFFKQAIDLNTYQTPEIRQKLADNLMSHNSTNSGLTLEQVMDNYELGINELKKVIKASPQDVRVYLYLMTLYNRAGMYNPSYFEEVVRWGDKALLLSPTRSHIYFEMGQARINQGRNEEGFAYFKKAIELNPDTVEVHWNAMAAYYIAGEDELAEKEIAIMQEIDPVVDFYKTPQILDRLFKVFLVAKRLPDAVDVLALKTEIENTGESFARLAAYYNEIGEIEKAREAVNKAVTLDPNLREQAENFLEILEESNQ